MKTKSLKHQLWSSLAAGEFGIIQDLPRGWLLVVFCICRVEQKVMHP